MKSAFKFSRGQVDVQVFEVVDEFEEQLKLRQEELLVKDKSPRASQIDEEKGDSEWSDSESEKSMGLDA